MAAKLEEWEWPAVLWQAAYLLSYEHTQPNSWDIAQIQVLSAHLPNSLMPALLHLKKLTGLQQKTARHEKCEGF